MPSYIFPPNFVWGAATASYQIEGAVHADGRGESIWDRFSHTPNKTKSGATGDIACEHYQRWPEDFALLSNLGATGYRFSIAWPRILPNGRGPVNQAGLDFYQRQVEDLLHRGITPYVTLYHWDLPVALEDAGGWPIRATAEAFAEYASIVAQTLGDRVKHWITINEPWCVSMLGYQTGVHAPGRQDWTDALAASHHTLLAHGLAEPEIRRYSPGAEVGITLNFTASVPASTSPTDRDAARAYDGYFNRWFLDPIYGRGYPADMVSTYLEAGFLPEGLNFVQPGDMDIIAAATDFLGVNYYTREVLTASAQPGFWETVQLDTPRTEMGWEIYPEGLYSLLLRLYSAYDVPRIYITENGVSYLDAPDADGQVHDLRRIEFLRQHLEVCHRAMSAGVPLVGYFQWTLLDNFEWALGYSQRFGAVYVDYATQRRTPKDSFFWYRDIITRNGFDI